MKIAVTGYGGKIGSILLGRADFVSLDCDITQIRSIDSAVALVKPDLIVNCAAISSIERCEKDEKLALLSMLGDYTIYIKFLGKRY